MADKLSKKVLEIGCGLGDEAIWYAGRGYQVSAIDLNSETISNARLKSSKVDFRVMDATRLIFSDNFFDMVIANDILEHIDNYRIVLEEVARVLKPAGNLILEIPSAKSEEILLKVHPAYFKEVGHKHIFNLNDLQVELRRAGFEVMKISGIKGMVHLMLYLGLKQGGYFLDELGTLSNRTIRHYQFMMLFDTKLFRRPKMRWLFPLWIFTLPIGFILSLICPKSRRIIAVKKSYNRADLELD